MSFFFGFFPDEKTNYKISKVIVYISKIFNDFQIPVRWSKPDTYHITLLYIGDNVSFLRQLIWKFRLKTIYFTPFKVSFNTVKLGISRKYKELVYLDIKEGGEMMRKILLDIRKALRLKDSGNFIPHLTLGRVNKDLSKEEYSNICKDFSIISKDLNIEDIEFYVNDIKLIRSKENHYFILINLTDFSKIKL